MIIDKIHELGLTLDEVNKKKFKGMVFDLILKKTTMEKITKKLMGY